MIPETVRICDLPSAMLHDELADSARSAMYAVWWRHGSQTRSEPGCFVTDNESAASLTSDDCVIDGTAFFVRGCIEIPVHGQADPFIWGVWVSLSVVALHTQMIHPDGP